MKRIAFVVLLAATLAACATATLGPSAPPSYAPYAPPPTGQFRPQDFAWSTIPGSASIQGVVAYREGPTRFSCEGRDVILTPETPWSRRRMVLLYGSADSAAIPVAEVRTRTQSAPSGDYARYVRKTTCDGANHFGFGALPSGRWFVITIVRPVGSGDEPMAIMRRVETRTGPRFLTLD
jgi:hypothetical protein